MTVGCCRLIPLPERETGNWARTVPERNHLLRRLLVSLILLLALGLASSARAALQFDVFLGYDGVVPEGAWFPVMFEVKNDGPPFTGTVDVDGGAYNQGQVRRMIVAWPPGTQNRLVIPV